MKECFAKIFMPALTILLCSCGSTTTKINDSDFVNPTLLPPTTNSESQMAASSPSPAADTIYFRFVCAENSISSTLTTFADLGTSESKSLNLSFKDPHQENFVLSNLSEPALFSSENGQTSFVFEASSIETRQIAGNLFRPGIYFGSREWSSQKLSASLLASDQPPPAILDQVFSRFGFSTKKHFGIDSSAKALIIPDGENFSIGKLSYPSPAKFEVEQQLWCPAQYCWNPLINDITKRAAFTWIEPDSARIRLRLGRWLDSKDIHVFDPLPIDEKVDQISPLLMVSGTTAWLEVRESSLSLAVSDANKNFQENQIADLKNSQLFGEPGWREIPETNSLELVISQKEQNQDKITYSMRLLSLDATTAALKQSTYLPSLDMPLRKIIAITADLIYATFETRNGIKVFRLKRNASSWERINSANCDQPGIVLARESL